MSASTGSGLDPSSAIASAAPLRAILVGANPEGRGGELYRATLASRGLVEIVGVCDTDPRCREFWGVPSAANIRDLIDLVRPAAALLAVPHAAYQRLRNDCIHAGLALFHEKPLACTLSELLELQRTLGERPVPLVVGVQRRSHPSYVELRRIFERSPPETLHVRMALGRPQADASSGWRGDRAQSGGGALIDIGYHAIDLVQFLLDAPLHVVVAQLWRDGAPLLDRELETAATVVGRCGPTWVRVDVDRTGTKAEYVDARNAEGDWRTDRDGISVDGRTVFRCDKEWDAALLASLAALAEAAKAPSHVTSLWDQMAVLQVVEHAYRAVPLRGLGRAPLGPQP